MKATYWIWFQSVVTQKLIFLCLCYIYLKVHLLWISVLLILRKIYAVFVSSPSYEILNHYAVFKFTSCRGVDIN